MTTELLDGIWGSDGGNIFVVGYGGVILRTTDSGASWIAQTSGTNQPLTAIWGASAKDVYTVGFAGTILHSSGGAWTSQISGTTANLSTVWGTSSGDVVVGGAAPVGKTALLHSTGNGAWTDVSGNPGAELIDALWGTGGELFGVFSSTALHSDNGAMSWDATPTQVGNTILFAIWGAANNDLYAVGSSGTIIQGQ